MQNKYVTKDVWKWKKHDFLAVFCLDLLNIEHDESANFYLKVIANVFVASDFNIAYFLYAS